MKAFNNLKIGVKITLGFAVVVLLIIIMAVIVYTRIQQTALNNSLSMSRERDIASLLEVEKLLYIQYSYQADYIINSSQEAADSFRENAAQLEEMEDHLYKIMDTPEEQQWIAEIQKDNAEFHTIFTEKIAPAVEAGSLDEIVGYDDQSDTLLSKMVENAGKIQVSLKEEALEAQNAANEAQNQAFLTLAVITIAVAILSMVMAVVIARTITAPLHLVMDTSRRIAEDDLTRLASEMDVLSQGDLTRRFSVTAQPLAIDTRDETGQLAQAFNAMIFRLSEAGKAFENALTGLNTTMHQTQSVSQQVLQGVEQVRSVAQNLASNAQEQSAAVEEVTTNLEETNAQVAANAENSGISNKLAGQMTQTANDGQRKMEAMTQAMGSIARSSQEIARIIKVIDEIAFQTNLLALNAAVEAARAGQHGRGFAVVAQEVRNLAERSAKAAKETTQLIEDAATKVRDGVTIANEMSAAMAEVTHDAMKVRDIAAEVAAASEEQTRAIAQVNMAMMQVNQGAQTNSSQSEELASTADELAGLANRLGEEVSRFKLRQQQFIGEGQRLSPELLQALAQAGLVLGESPRPAEKQPPSNNGKRVAMSSLDRDERGYGNF